MFTYTYANKSVPCYIDGIKNDVAISAMTNKNIQYCNWSEETQNLDITWDLELSTGDKTILDTIVTSNSIAPSYKRGDPIPETWIRPTDILIYYGWLNSFNSDVNGFNNELVAQDFSKFGILVFGDGLQDPSHGDYANTIVIIPRIKALNPSTKIFGYVSCNQTYAAFTPKVDQWVTLNVDGIFIDSAGYDYGTVATNGREAFNAKVDYVHSKLKIAFSNAWNMDHIIGVVNDPSYPNSTWNPSLVASKLSADDWYLLESFAINTTSFSGSGGYEDKAEWFSRGQKAINHRKTFGIHLCAISVIGDSNSNASALFNFGFISALIFSLELFGSSDDNYGASSAKTTYRTRPDTNGCGKIYQIAPTIQNLPNDTDVYIRFSEHAKFLLDFSTGAQLSSITKTGYSGLPQTVFRRYGSGPEVWYSYLATGTAGTTGSPTINVLRAFPFIVEKTCRLDRIAINVTTGGASSHYRLGIYNDSGNGYPGSLLLDAGVVDTSTSGVKAITINQTLTPGLYWLVCVGDGTAPTVRCFAIAGLVTHYVMGVDNTLPTTPAFGYSYSFTYAALPATFGTSPSLITAVPIPAIFVRLSM